MRQKLLHKIICVLLCCAVCRQLTIDAHAVIFFTIEDAPTPLAAASVVLTPATGTQAYSAGGATVDYSNTAEGYIMARYSGGRSKIKLQITKSGSSTTYTYNLNSGGAWEVFPLTAGDGSYKVGIYENISGDQYAQALSTTVTAVMRSSLLPYLYPNQYVNFNADSATVKKGAELASAADNQLGIVSSVYNYVTSNISYDTQKADSVQSGYLPVVDTILSSGKGICFDYASLMATMLRSQNIPTRVQVGYVSGGVYHAWISVYTPETGWINNIIQFDGLNWMMMDPTFAASGGANKDFVGNGSNYSLMYQY